MHLRAQLSFSQSIFLILYTPSRVMEEKKSKKNPISEQIVFSPSYSLKKQHVLGNFKEKEKLLR